MNYEQIQLFMALPTLSDIITIVLYAITMILMLFLKMFVKRDNNNVLIVLNKKNNELDTARKELQEARKQIECERSRFEKDKIELTNEINLLKDAIKIVAGNTKELVANGTAKHVADMISNNKEEEIVNE